MPVTDDRKPRWDKGVENAPVIRGLRMEPKLADAFVKHAKHAAAQRGEDVPDLAREVRRMLRRAVFGTPADDPPAGPEKWPILARGLKGDPTLVAAVHRQCKADFGIAGCVRHLLRVQLKWSVVDSIAQENRFQAIAEAKHGLMDRKR